MVFGLLCYSLFFGIFAYKVSLTFAFTYVGFPFLENVLNISAYNWTWHAFIDPDDPTNEYANSITIVDGSYNMIDRDLHVVHHSFPGVHWSKYRQLFEKD